MKKNKNKSLNSWKSKRKNVSLPYAFKEIKSRKILRLGEYVRSAADVLFFAVIVKGHLKTKSEKMNYIVIVILIIIIIGAIQAFYNKKENLLINNTDLLEAGQLLFPGLKTDFEIFFNTFIQDKKKFLMENKELLENYDNFELDKLEPIEVIYIFGDSKGKLWMTDWRGEENEREIEYFLEDNLQIKTGWEHVNQTRTGIDEEKQKDGKFIIDLLKAIDKDLENLDKRLIFLDLHWDAYVYTVVDQDSYKTIADKVGALFHGTEKLKW